MNMVILTALKNWCSQNWYNLHTLRIYKVWIQNHVKCFPVAVYQNFSSSKIINSNNSTNHFLYASLPFLQDILSALLCTDTTGKDSFQRMEIQYIKERKFWCECVPSTARNEKEKLLTLFLPSEEFMPEY